MADISEQNLADIVGDFISNKIGGSNGTQLIISIKNAVNPQFKLIVQGILDLFAVYLVCWILYDIYQILFQHKNRSLKNFLWDLTIKAFVIGACVKSSEIPDLVIQALNGYKDFICKDTSTIFMLASNFAKNAIINGGVVLDEASILATIGIGKSENSYIISCILFCLCLSGAFLGVYPPIRTFFVNAISFILLTSTLPFVLALFVIGTLKDVFKQWLNLMLSNLLSITFLFLITRPAMSYITSNMLKQIDKNTSGYVIAFSIILSGAMIQIICEGANALAKNLTQVSLDGAIGSATSSALGTIGAGAGVGAGVASLGVRTAGAGLAPVGKGVGKSIGKGVSAGAKKLWEAWKNK